MKSGVSSSPPRADADTFVDGFCEGQHDVEPTLPKEGEVFRWRYGGVTLHGHGTTKAGRVPKQVHDTTKTYHY